jgi:thymidylate kinase
MIIELFGPPCVGKTTFAHALAARLRGKAPAVELALSYRPSEVSPDAMAASSGRSQIVDAAQRLTRPILEMLASGSDLSGRSPEAHMAATLLKMLPPKSILWAARMRQYIWRRGHLWRDSQHAAGIVIFDQAFIQVVYSLLVLGGRADEALIAQALDAVPMPDLLIRLEAPLELVRARLVDRRRRQGSIERLLEIDVRKNLETIGVIDVLHDLLRKRGQTVICIDSADPRQLDEAMCRLEHEVMARFAPIGVAA